MTAAAKIARPPTRTARPGARKRILDGIPAERFRRHRFANPRKFDLAGVIDAIDEKLRKIVILHMMTR